MPPHKRTIREIRKLQEPVLSDSQRRYMAEGIELFNAGKYWHAHEAWEQAWLEMSNAPEDDGEIVLRGLIQLAAGFHLCEAGRLDGAASNFEKARTKLKCAPKRFLGVEIAPLISFLDKQTRKLVPEDRCLIQMVGTG